MSIGSGRSPAAGPPAVPSHGSSCVIGICMMGRTSCTIQAEASKCDASPGTHRSGLYEAYRSPPSLESSTPSRRRDCRPAESLPGRLTGSLRCLRQRVHPDPSWRTGSPAPVFEPFGQSGRVHGPCGLSVAPPCRSTVLEPRQEGDRSGGSIVRFSWCPFRESHVRRDRVAKYIGMAFA